MYALHQQVRRGDVVSTYTWAGRNKYSGPVASHAIGAIQQLRNLRRGEGGSELVITLDHLGVREVIHDYVI